MKPADRLLEAACGRARLAGDPPPAYFLDKCNAEAGFPTREVGREPPPRGLAWCLGYVAGGAAGTAWRNVRVLTTGRA